MPLETLSDPNARLNIKGLSIEESRQHDIPFDVEREITSEDWGGMDRELEEYRKKKWTMTFATQGAKMKIIDPTHEVRVTEEDWLRLRRKLGEHRDDNFVGDFIKLAGFMKLLGSSYKLELIESDWPKMDKLLQALRGTKDDTITARASHMHILDPNHDLGFTADDWTVIKEKLISRTAGDLLYLARSAAEVRLLDPQYNFGLTAEDWSRFHARLEEARRKAESGSAYFEFSDMAASMKILAAEKVMVTDKGIELVMPSKEEEEIDQPLPTTRKF